MERLFHRWLSSRARAGPGVRIGIGDDAAILQPSPGMELVVTTDMLMDGVDFIATEVSPERIGRKALAVNLSDLAAMGAQPLAAFPSLALATSTDLEFAQRLYLGMESLAREFSCELPGGDTNCWRHPLCINVTALGQVRAGEGWLRSGARPGDRLLVTGELGGSILGKHLDFQPRVREAGRLRELATIKAAMDISDGLALDALRLSESSGCGVVFTLDRLPISPAAHQLSTTSGQTPLQHALADGEDFELLLAVDEVTAARLLQEQPLDVPLTEIGFFIESPGLFSQPTSATDWTPLPATGWVHGNHVDGKPTI